MTFVETVRGALRDAGFTILETGDRRLLSEGMQAQVFWSNVVFPNVNRLARYRHVVRVVVYIPADKGEDFVEQMADKVIETVQGLDAAITAAPFDLTFIDGKAIEKNARLRILQLEATEGCLR